MSYVRGRGLEETRKGVRRRTELEKLYKRREKDSSSVGGGSIYDATDQGCREMA
jgi:hypothetical protein